MTNIRVCCLSAETDKEFLLRLSKHLYNLPFIEGDFFTSKDGLFEVVQAIREAGILLVLISADFFSDYNTEVLKAIEERVLGKSGIVIPVKVKDYNASHYYFVTQLENWLPSRERAVEHINNDRVWTYVVSGIYTVVEALIEYERQNPGSLPAPTHAARSLPTGKHKERRGKKPMITILFAGANPSNTTRLALGKEIRTIEERLRGSAYRNRFKLEQAHAIRVDDLLRLLLHHRPTIMHLSGHGSREGEIILEDDNGVATTVSQEALANLFRIINKKSKTVRCVILNACYSESQAEAIGAHVECVIGMSKAIPDNAAIAFSAGFYEALGYGEDIETAFELACTLVDAKKLGPANMIQLMLAPGVVASQVRLEQSTAVSQGAATPTA